MAGERSCIGQTLAQMELKVALVMTMRTFDIIPAYAEWDGLHPKKGIKTVNGNRAYQAEMGGGGAHPADGFPVLVTEASWSLWRLLGTLVQSPNN
ncbi:hypothetical protein F5B22DRAFT_644507 [Xylaria bambusicola]|uniref:uncharacterized protein n=1 Tax=Xylaria bambusicola TaxID=326684 RepID=UPI0020083C65|nr:uncharacterized protein F5B22DRAFT_644507 [Xylaria bambusicola]KAI0520761.1 hypothetical protein F5B22DRAFT_644507 [Xylaria bambusicola]